MVRGVGGGILEGRQLFLIFPSKGGGGDYLRETINQGKAIT